ncbi:DUF4192 family protein [uncultured Tessaracoccus sp.]|uniref:DUF4192 family protein n=1 Tax=uncultured Tessaracoccus sp. TaxID=905023 RepID=UPI00260FAB63|nr:DUF4192 family protein [uncultured Tessaracoccus sp.]
MTITETRTVRCRSRAELLALPPAQFGFLPKESVVAMRMSGTEMLFMGRLDLSHVGESCQHAAESITRMAASNPARDPHWMLLGYTASPNLGAALMTSLADELDAVSIMVLTDGTSTWEVVNGTLIDEEAAVVSDALTEHIAELWPGEVAASRDEAVAGVYRWQPSKELTSAARRRVEALNDAARMELLESLLGGTLTDAEAAELAVLLGYEEPFGEVVAQMNRDVAPSRRASLLAARVQAPVRSVANVLSLLALAYWLEGAGALAAECLIQINRDEERHPLADTVGVLLKLGVPPSRWDER